MNIVLWVLQVLLAVIMLFHSYLYVAWPANMIEQMRKRQPNAATLSLSPVFRRFIGLAEGAAALGLILPALTGILPWLTPLAAVGVIVVMGSAMVFHVRAGEAPMAVGLLVILLM